MIKAIRRGFRDDEQKNKASTTAVIEKNSERTGKMLHIRDYFQSLWTSTEDLLNVARIIYQDLLRNVSLN